MTFDKFYSILIEQFTTKEDAVAKLSGFLKGGLAGTAEDFVNAGEQYDVDPFLMASIATLETGWGTAPVLTKHKNVSGKWDNNTKTHATYSNVRDSIYDQAKFLRQNYLDKGLTSIEAIGAKYAPPGAANDPNGTNAMWPSNVSKLYSQVTGSATRDLLAGGSFTGQGTAAVEEPDENTIKGALGKVASGFTDLLKPAGLS